jgi:hypothetical protein
VVSYPGNAVKQRKREPKNHHEFVCAGTCAFYFLLALLTPPALIPSPTIFLLNHHLLSTPPLTPFKPSALSGSSHQGFHPTRWKPHSLANPLTPSFQHSFLQLVAISSVKKAPSSSLCLHNHSTFIHSLFSRHINLTHNLICFSPSSLVIGLYLTRLAKARRYDASHPLPSG